MAKRKKKQGGRGSFLMITVLILAGGLGGWNYQRNLAIETEKASSRPFEGYTDVDLEQLAAAYGETADILDRKHRATKQTRTGVRDTGALMDEKVREFERVQKVGESIRAAMTLVADSEARLRQIKEEQQWRRNEGQIGLHLRRLTSI